MSSDIGEQLLRDIRRDFAAELGDNDKRLAALLKKITDKKANLFDVSLFSSECGKALSRALAKNLSPEMLRNGAVTYEITRTLLHGVMKDNYDLINMAAQAVQQRLDNDLKIHIAPQTAAFPAQRIDSIASSLTDTAASDATLKRRMDAPVRNVTDSFYTDYVETNADLRSRSGLKTTITRVTNGKCCDWCAAIAGHYVYPDVPENIWAFHDNCTCSLLYSSAKTTSMHSRLNRSGYRLEGKAKERALRNAAKPVRFTREQAENLQNNILNRLAFSENSGIIKSIDVDDYELITYGKKIAPEVSKVILSTMKKSENENGFVISEISTDVKSNSTHGTPVLQIEPLSNGLLQLNINANYFSEKSLEEINEAFAKSENTVVNSLQEALIHESGHAISLKGRSYNEISKLYDELSHIHLSGVSDIALQDGAECLAELEVLRSRGVQVNDELKEFYKKYMGRDY